MVDFCVSPFLIFFLWGKVRYLLWIFIIFCYWLKTHIGTSAITTTATIKIGVVNIMTTSIPSTHGTRQFPLAWGVCFLQLSSVVCLPYDYIRVNDLFIYLIRIYTPSQTNRIICRNVSGRVAPVQLYGPYHMVLFFCAVLWIIVTKVDFYWVPIDTKIIFWNPVLTPIEPHVHVYRLILSLVCVGSILSLPKLF